MAEEVWSGETGSTWRDWYLNKPTQELRVQELETELLREKQRRHEAETALSWAGYVKSNGSIASPEATRAYAHRRGRDFAIKKQEEVNFTSPSPPDVPGELPPPLVASGAEPQLPYPEPPAAVCYERHTSAEKHTPQPPEKDHQHVPNVGDLLSKLEDMKGELIQLKGVTGVRSPPAPVPSQPEKRYTPAPAEAYPRDHHERGTDAGQVFDEPRRQSPYRGRSPDSYPRDKREAVPREGQSPGGRQSPRYDNYPLDRREAVPVPSERRQSPHALHQPSRHPLDRREVVRAPSEKQSPRGYPNHPLYGTATTSGDSLIAKESHWDNLLTDGWEGYRHVENIEEKSTRLRAERALKERDEAVEREVVAVRGEPLWPRQEERSSREDKTSGRSRSRPRSRSRSRSKPGSPKQPGGSNYFKLPPSGPPDKMSLRAPSIRSNTPPNPPSIKFPSPPPSPVRSHRGPPTPVRSRRSASRSA